jgi:hypothetical protein
MNKYIFIIRNVVKYLERRFVYATLPSVCKLFNNYVNGEYTIGCIYSSNNKLRYVIKNSLCNPNIIDDLYRTSKSKCKCIPFKDIVSVYDSTYDNLKICMLCFKLICRQCTKKEDSKRCIKCKELYCRECYESTNGICDMCNYNICYTCADDYIVYCECCHIYYCPKCSDINKCKTCGIYCCDKCLTEEVCTRCNK